MKVTLHFFVLFEIWGLVSLELFTSVEHLQILVETQEHTIKCLEKYLRRESKRNNIIEKYFERFKTEHELAMKNVSYYLGNPMNALTLIKRLTLDLNFIETKIKSVTAFRHQPRNQTYPTRNDFVGAVKAMMRLQATYQLNVTQLANGELVSSFTADGKEYKDVFTPLTASDCFQIGLGFYNETEYGMGVTWMLMAHEKFQLEGDDDHELDGADIINHICLAYIKLDDVKNILIWMKKLIALRPKDPHAPRWSDLVIKYENRLAKEQKMKEEGWWREVPWSDDFNEDDEDSQRALEEQRHIFTPAQLDQRLFEIYCGNEVLTVPPEISKILKCRYLTGPHPFLRLARVKLEQLYPEPPVILLRDVISDHDIAHLKSFATPRMKTPTNIKRHSSDAIISKSCSVPINESVITRKIQRRVAIFTGLVEGLEPLQVSNYGISGHRLPHYDFLRLNGSDSPTFSAKGDYIATAFFFMSEVLQGGATVFPRLGLTVYPEKGSALFWYNLHPSGEGNIATQHAECPVLQGNKWAAVLWKSLLGQELRRPCTLKRQELCDLRRFHYDLPVMVHERYERLCTDLD